MASSISKAFSPNKTDELYTPKILVDPIVKHLRIFYRYWINRKYMFQRLPMRKPIILCPFDKEDSEFVIAFSKMNDFELKFGHIDTGQDFFNYDYGEYDVVISNPPFSRKKEVLEKLLTEKRSFALIGNAMIINYEEIGRLFAYSRMQILSFDRRISYNGKPSSFMSCYFCHDFLKQDLMFEMLSNNNAGKNFVPSRMYTRNCA